MTLGVGQARGCPLPPSGPPPATKPAISSLETGHFQLKPGRAGSSPSLPPVTSGTRRKLRRHSLAAPFAAARRRRAPLPPSTGSSRDGSGRRLVAEGYGRWGRAGERLAGVVGPAEVTHSPRPALPPPQPAAAVVRRRSVPRSRPPRRGRPRPSPLSRRRAMSSRPLGAPRSREERPGSATQL